MNFVIPRQLVLDRIQERIKFIEAKVNAFEERQKKLKEVDPARYGHISALSTSGVDNQLKTLRFAIEYMATTPNIEMNLTDALLLGVVDPTNDAGLLPFLGGELFTA